MKTKFNIILINLAWSGLAFLLSFLLLGLTYMQFGFYPFGSRSILVMDMLQQNVAFFQSLRDIMSGQHSLFYSLGKSLGGNYLGLFAFYISSPLSWIVTLFPENEIHLAITILMWIKTALTASTMFYFLNTKFPNMPFRSLIIAIAYSLMSYNFVYSLSLMWIDGVLFLPLVILGVETIIQKKQFVLFTIFYSLLLLANYYTAYMVGIFAFLYFITRQTLQAATPLFWKQSLAAFAIGTTLSFLLTAWLWLPVAFDLFSGKLETGTWMNSNFFHFQFGEVFSQLLPHQYDSIILGLPSIYVGWSLELLALLFFFLPTISKTEKRSWGLVLLIFYLSFWIVRLDDIWHGFVSPNWFPYRYAFLFSFVLLWLAAKTLSLIHWQPKPRFLSYLLIFLYGPILMDLSQNGVSMLQGLQNQFGYMESSLFESRYQETEDALALIPTSEQIHRIEKDYEITKNDPLLFGYEGISHYSSNYQAQVNQTMQRLGFAQAWYWNSYMGSTPVMDSVLGIRYLLSRNNYGYPYAFYDAVNGVKVYENPLALPLIFSAHESIQSLAFQSYDPFVEQSSLIQAIHGTTESPWIPLSTLETELTSTIKTFTIQPQLDSPIYFYIDSNTHGTGSLSVNGQFWGSYFGQTTSKISTFPASSSLGEMIIRVQNTSPEKMSVYDGFFYQLDTEQLAVMAHDIQQRSRSAITYEQGVFEGSVTVDDQEMIATSIPYLRGYSVYLNEKKVSYRSYYSDTFLMIPVDEPGTYHIRIDYVSEGFEIGLALTLMTLSGIISFGIYQKRLKLKPNLSPLHNSPKSS